MSKTEIELIVAKKRKSAPRKSSAPGEQRINKILASAGIGSRREVEELIVQGRVEIDREIVTNLATTVDPQKVKIKVDGTLLKASKPVYFALNKPSGVLSTNRDPSGRMRVIDLVPDSARVFSVGRLDKSSEGLILLTNDGEIAQRLAHPKFRIQKTYFVVVAGTMTQEELVKLRKGVHLAEGFARIDGAEIRKHRKGCTEIEIVLSEGKNREIRRILARAGHKVVVLRRIAIGPLRLGQLPLGASRELRPAEIKALYAATDPSKRPKKKASSVKGKKPSKKKKAAAQIEDDEALDLGFTDDDFISNEEFGGDDDFVGSFSDSPKTGSVLTFDDEPSPERSAPKRAAGKRQTKKKTARGGQSRGTGRDATTRRPGKKKTTRRGETGRPTKKSKASTKSSSRGAVSKRRGSSTPSRSPTAGKGRGTGRGRSR